VILGIGSDLIDIRRMERVITRFGERFLDRVFTSTERAKSEGRKNRIESYAKRFAAKEACSKALGTGFRKGVFMRDMGVINKPGGQPTIALTGGAAARLAAITPAGMRAEVHVSLTDEPPMAQAIVIIETVAADGGKVPQP
jgi:holo-[acyl-carrier protein] synthase